MFKYEVPPMQTKSSKVSGRPDNWESSTKKVAHVSRLENRGKQC